MSQDKLRSVVEGLLEYKEENDTLKAPTQEKIGEFMGYSDTTIGNRTDGDYLRAIRLAGMIPRSERVPGDYMEAFQQLEPEERETARKFEENSVTGKFYSEESQLTYSQAREKAGLEP